MPSKEKVTASVKFAVKRTLQCMYRNYPQNIKRAGSMLWTDLLARKNSVLMYAEAIFSLLLWPR